MTNILADGTVEILIDGRKIIDDGTIIVSQDRSRRIAPEITFPLPVEMRILKTTSLSKIVKKIEKSERKKSAVKWGKVRRKMRSRKTQIQLFIHNWFLKNGINKIDNQNRALIVSELTNALINRFEFLRRL